MGRPRKNKENPPESKPVTVNSGDTIVCVSRGENLNPHPDVPKELDDQLNCYGEPPERQPDIATLPNKKEKQNTPPFAFNRNNYGLFEHLDYVFDENGLVNWRKMIPTRYLYLNPTQDRRAALEKKYNKKYDEIKIIEDKVEDEDLVIALGGINYLLWLRGYSHVETVPIKSEDGFCVVSCVINFVPCYENGYSACVFTENACAHGLNTRGFGRNYLVEMATNRAIGRCVRRFLRIEVLSQFEVSEFNESEESKSVNLPDYLVQLEGLMKETGITFEMLRAKFEAEGDKNAASYLTLEHVPKNKIFETIERLKLKQAKANENFLESGH